jgi:hypothetical protein
MKTKIPGAILTALLFIVIGYFVIGLDQGIPFNLENQLSNAYPAYYATLMSRLVDYASGNLVNLFTALSQMLWGYRGIDMVVQGVFLFSAALASSVFFREVQRRRK